MSTVIDAHDPSAPSGHLPTQAWGGRELYIIGRGRSASLTSG